MGQRSCPWLGCLQGVSRAGPPPPLGVGNFTVPIVHLHHPELASLIHCAGVTGLHPQCCFSSLNQ
jgi:hypothetical protein